jgi:hypothetical protein
MNLKDLTNWAVYFFNVCRIIVFILLGILGLLATILGAAVLLLIEIPETLWSKLLANYSKG